MRPGYGFLQKGASVPLWLCSVLRSVYIFASRSCDVMEETGVKGAISPQSENCTGPQICGLGTQLA